MFWLVKSEPENYSIEDFERERSTNWDGVRNFQARNMLRDDFKVGDKVLFYHSGVEPVGVFGTGKVSKVGVPDSTQFDPKSDYFDPKAKRDAPTWWAPKVSFERKFKKPVTLADLRACKALSSMMILKRGNRLSVTPVTSEEYQTVLKLADGK